MTLATPIMNQLKSFQMGASIFCLLYLCVFGVALIFAGFYFGKSMCFLFPTIICIS